MRSATGRFVIYIISSLQLSCFPFGCLNKCTVSIGAESTIKRCSAFSAAWQLRLHDGRNSHHLVKMWPAILCGEKHCVVGWKIRWSRQIRWSLRVKRNVSLEDAKRPGQIHKCALKWKTLRNICEIFVKNPLKNIPSEAERWKLRNSFTKLLGIVECATVISHFTSAKPFISRNSCSLLIWQRKRKLRPRCKEKRLAEKWIVVVSGRYWFNCSRSIIDRKFHFAHSKFGVFLCGLCIVYGIAVVFSIRFIDLWQSFSDSINHNIIEWACDRARITQFHASKLLDTRAQTTLTNHSAPADTAKRWKKHLMTNMKPNRD